MAKTWVDGEVITAEALNALELNAQEAHDLATTNESDIDSIDHIVTAIAHDVNGTPQLSDGIVVTSAIKDGAVTGEKVSVGNGLAVNGSTHALEVPVDGTTIGYSADGLHVVNPVASKVKQMATVPDTLKNVSVSHLYAEPDGTLAEGVFDITNGNSTGMTIAAETVIATGLDLASGKTYSCLVWGTGDPLTLEVNDTGKSINFTTDVRVEGNSTLHIYVRDNEG